MVAHTLMSYYVAFTALVMLLVRFAEGFGPKSLQLSSQRSVRFLTQHCGRPDPCVRGQLGLRRLLVAGEFAGGFRLRG
jgi:hypothetical protein